jgi:beta-glucanase (GH16 family)
LKGTGKGSKLTVLNPHEDFHVYAVEWTEKRMDFFVDEQKYFSMRTRARGAMSGPMTSHTT